MHWHWNIEGRIAVTRGGGDSQEHAQFDIKTQFIDLIFRHHRH